MDEQETTYEVTWSIELTAVDGKDAASQAWTILTDAATGVGPATVLVVRRPSGLKVGVFDMEDAQVREVAG